MDNVNFGLGASSVSLVTGVHKSSVLGGGTVAEITIRQTEYDRITEYLNVLSHGHSRPVASGRHQGGQKKYKGGRNFWKQILTDNFIVTQNSCKRVCFFAKKRRNSVKSNAAVRLFSNVR